MLSISVTSCFPPVNFNGAYQYAGTERVPKGLPSKPGACYAKCILSDVYQTNTEELFLFTGDPENTTAKIQQVDIMEKEGGTKWVKKKADRNCLSANPDDCLVWCLEKVDVVKESYIVVLDTSTTDEFKVFIRETKELISKGGPTEWREIVCHNKMSPNLIKEVQGYLSTSGYYFGDEDGIMDEGLREALVNFQVAHGLAKGQLTLESLDIMGVAY